MAGSKARQLQARLNTMLSNPPEAMSTIHLIDTAEIEFAITDELQRRGLHWLNATLYAENAPPAAAASRCRRADRVPVASTAGTAVQPRTPRAEAATGGLGMLRGAIRPTGAGIRPNGLSGEAFRYWSKRAVGRIVCPARMGD